MEVAPTQVMTREAAGAELEADNETFHRSYNIVVDATPDVAFEQFKETVWRGLGFQAIPLLNLLPGATIIEQGGEHGVGQVRVVPGSWMPAIQEEILAVAPNESISYRVRKGPWPATGHKGLVSFVAVEDGKTKVTWSVQMTPFRGCSPLLGALVWMTFEGGLRSLKKAIKKRNKTK